MRIAASRIGRLICALVAMSAVTATAFADAGAAPLPSGPPLLAPGALVGRHGQLHVDLTAAPGAYTIGGERFEGMLYPASPSPPEAVQAPEPP